MRIDHVFRKRGIFTILFMQTVSATDPGTARLGGENGQLCHKRGRLSLVFARILPEAYEHIHRANSITSYSIIHYPFSLKLDGSYTTPRTLVTQ